MKDIRWFAGALALLGVFAVISALTGPLPAAPPLSVRGAGPDGALVLWRWLEQSGYPVRQVLSDPIRPEGVDVLFVLSPLTPYSRQEAERVRDWVRAGNTLVVAGMPFMVNDLLEPYGVSVAYFTGGVEPYTPAAPTLVAPPFDAVYLGAQYKVVTDRADAVVHLAAASAPVLVSFNEERGTVWVLGGGYPFSNRGLRDPASARLVLNLLAGAAEDARIGFDEARHGFSGAPASLFDWFVGTAPGWGILAAVALTMGYLALRGRRFGRALPLPESRVRREPVEYIQAMANLFRRSGQRKAMLDHYGRQLRRRLSERYALDPRLSDAGLVQAVARRDPAADAAELGRLLKRLSSGRAGEYELVGIALEVDSWLRKLN
ncbi:MAG: DUF4350 domain-containing protein [Anaerolineae bacterium]|nr:DUF4350 domain-containing protein [Anaerolineae bacterium]